MEDYDVLRAQPRMISILSIVYITPLGRGIRTQIGKIICERGDDLVILTGRPCLWSS